MGELETCQCPHKASFAGQDRGLRACEKCKEEKLDGAACGGPYRCANCEAEGRPSLLCDDCDKTTCGVCDNVTMCADCADDTSPTCADGCETACEECADDTWSDCNASGCDRKLCYYCVLSNSCDQCGGKNFRECGMGKSRCGVFSVCVNCMETF